MWHNASNVTLATGIDQFTDLSGNGLHATQSGTGQQATLNLTGGIDGGPVAEFDGTDDHYDIAWAVSQATEVFAALIPSRSDSINKTPWDAPEGNQHRLYSSTDRLILTSDGSNQLTRTGVDLTGYNRINGVYNGASSALRVGGLAEVTGNAGTNGTTALLLGIYGNGTLVPADMDFLEWIWFQRVLDATERALVNAYLTESYPSLTAET